MGDRAGRRVPLAFPLSCFGLVSVGLLTGLTQALIDSSFVGSFAAPTTVNAWFGLAALAMRAEIEAALRERLAELGGRIEWSSRVTGVRQDRDGVTADLESGTTLRSRWLVGCDGTNSDVRQSAGIVFPRVSLSERFLLADVHAPAVGSDARRRRDRVLLSPAGQLRFPRTGYAFGWA